MIRMREVASNSLLVGGLALALMVPCDRGQAKSRESVLYSFTGSPDGSNPQASQLIMDQDGNLYGTTSSGGGSKKCYPQPGCGTVFKVAPNGRETVLVSFHYRDGAYPDSALIMDTKGNLYGTTGGGGKDGDGTVFSVGRNRALTVLHSFRGGDDGDGPWGIIADKAGDFYGVTSNGGGSGCSPHPGCGSVFKLARGGEKILYAFAGGSDGAYPNSGLIMDGAGNFYGTTSDGGQTCPYRNDGCGTVFKVSPDGTETVLYRFCSEADCIDGYQPEAGVIRDKSGNLYGTTSGGGATNYYGTVFRLAADGTETVLYSFCSMANCRDGRYPGAGVIADRNGNFYGTTNAGGNDRSDCFNGCGTVFKLTPGGSETVLHSFSDAPDGAKPSFAGLLRDTGGNLYGTTYSGGSGGSHGMVFKIRN